jgi:hypothetical protein
MPGETGAYVSPDAVFNIPWRCSKCSCSGSLTSCGGCGNEVTGTKLLEPNVPVDPRKHLREHSIIRLELISKNSFCQARAII